MEITYNRWIVNDSSRFKRILLFNIFWILQLSRYMPSIFIKIIKSIRENKIITRRKSNFFIKSQIIKLKTLFVSVDPDRDSDEKINKFLAHFDKSIIGLKGATNDDPDLKEAMKQFKIYASKIKFEE